MHVGCCALLCLAIASCERTERIPLRALWADPARATPTLSPDGRTVAYIAPDRGVLNVWLHAVDAQGPNPDRPVTNERRYPIQGFAWDPVGRWIIYLRDSAGNGRMHAYAQLIDADSAYDLTPSSSGSASFATEPPTGSVLVSMPDLYRFDAARGQLLLDARAPDGAIAWAANGAARMVTVQRPDGTREFLYRTGNAGPWRQLWREPIAEADASPIAISNDGSTALLLSSVGAETTRLIAVDAGTGAWRALGMDPQYDVDDVWLRARSAEPEAVEVARSRKEWTVLDSNATADFAVLRAAHRGDLGVLSRDTADRRWIVSYTADDAPLVFALYDRSTRAVHPLFDAYPQLAGYRFARTDSITVTARDGLQLHGYVTRPVDAGHTPLPTAVVVHGGPWERIFWAFDPGVQFLANRGYAVLRVNFRGSAGYGKAFLHAGDREWGGAMETDIFDATRWAIAQHIADSTRIVILGSSYGGYATLMALAQAPSLYRCGVEASGPTDLAALIDGFPPEWGVYRSMFVSRIGDPKRDSAFLAGRSPITLVDRTRSPVLILHGLNDPIVSAEQSQRMIAALQARGRPVESVLVPSGHSSLDDIDTRMSFYSAIERFLARCLTARR